MSDAFQTGAETSVTIKYGKGFDETWAVFRGTLAAIREQIVEYFNLGGGDSESKALHELVVEATTLAHAYANLAKFGAKPIGSLGGSSTSSAAADAPAQPDEAQADPWAAASQPEDPDQKWLDAIERCPDRAALKNLWADNADTFQGNERLTAAWKARGKALPS